MFFVFPMLTFWILIYPLSCIYQIKKNYKRLDDPKVLAKYGLFINGYKGKLYYWYVNNFFLRKFLILLNTGRFLLCIRKFSYY